MLCAAANPFFRQVLQDHDSSDVITSIVLVGYTQNDLEKMLDMIYCSSDSLIHRFSRNWVFMDLFYTRDKDRFKTATKTSAKRPATSLSENVVTAKPPPPKKAKAKVQVDPVFQTFLDVSQTTVTPVQEKTETQDKKPVITCISLKKSESELPFFQVDEDGYLVEDEDEKCDTKKEPSATSEEPEPPKRPATRRKSSRPLAAAVLKKEDLSSDEDYHLPDDDAGYSDLEDEEGDFKEEDFKPKKQQKKTSSKGSLPLSPLQPLGPLLSCWFCDQEHRQAYF